MEFHIALAGAFPNPVIVQDALFDIDPTAMVDCDMGRQILRVSAVATTTDLLEIMQRIGWPVATEAVVQQPSICCGSCSG